MNGALLRYRVLAYVVGTLLIVLCVGVGLKYLSPDGSDAEGAGQWITHYIGITHGWLYMLFLVMAAMLAVRARWSVPFTVLTLASGIIPFGTFIVERKATARTRARMAEEDAAVAATSSSQPSSR